MADAEGQKSTGNTEEAARLWRAWRTANEMIQDRGYELADHEVQITFEDFLKKFRDDSDGTINRSLMKFSAGPTKEMIRKYSAPATTANPNPQADCGSVWVEFYAQSSIGVKQMREFVQHIDQHQFHTGILITPIPITASALKVIKVDTRKIEVFMDTDLLVNITHHELVPKHVLLSKEEKLRLLERYRVKDTQLPRIQMSDPIARYLGLNRGQIVKIIRKSETAGRYASYRLCV
ncbi:RNA polymerase Rpb5, C-terminal domain-containing protein [Calycina marina]|uniref:DNA-directed RNA polymerases I, II, and III subunit RPABC1 n=1 Tax=Calycina marina TaxID=1763456 RepID=A0A9P8CHU6_9HELO|nr:RNA polymerase Rpb5, C-terminal domain-containing protein [Calycina marina]